VRTVDGYASAADLDTFLGRLTEIAEETDTVVQAFDPSLVVSAGHLTTAADNAARAFERGENVAQDRGVEWLLYAAGRRQIDSALQMGVDEGTPAVVIGIDGRRADDPTSAELDAEAAVAEVVETEESPGDYDPARVREFFDITDTERQATEGTVSDIVLERVALLNVNK
jgi:Uncharacterized conserved protein